MAPFTGTTRGGNPWTPKFIMTINKDECIGCGRCFKICGRDVLGLITKPYEGDDEYGDNMGNKVMTIANPENCIGCEACSRTCTKKCQTFYPL